MISPQPEIRSQGRRFLAALAPVAWAGLILGLSLVPNPPGSVGFPGADKLLHAGAYFLLAGLAALAFAASGKDISFAGRAAFAVAVAFGAGVELLQGVMQLGRTAEWGDLLANTFGALLAYVIFRHTAMFFWRRLRTRDGRHG